MPITVTVEFFSSDMADRATRIPSTKREGTRVAFPAQEMASAYNGFRAMVMLAVSPINGSKVELLVSDDGAGIDPERVPRTFPDYGNIGPASVPFTLAGEAHDLVDGDRVLLMGIGSGLNASILEIAW